MAEPLALTFFILSSLAVAPFYLAMIFAPRRQTTRRLIGSTWSVALPAGLYMVYLALVVGLLQPDVVGMWRAFYLESGFFSAAAIRFLSSAFGEHVALAVLHGWVHVVVGDLFMARWAFLDAITRDTPRWQIPLVALLTAFLGPIGVVVHLVTRGTPQADL